MNSSELYKIKDGSIWQVHAGSTCLPVKNQRGKLYVNWKGKQINVKDITAIDQGTYPVYFGYVFEGGFAKGSNPYYNKILNGYLP